MVKVKFYGALKKYMSSADSEGFMTIGERPEGLTIEEVLAMTSLSDTNVRYSVLVNGAKKQKDYVLLDGDVIIVMPLLTGG